jgi:tetratricopeptide (TPR) repeat protein
VPDSVNPLYPLATLMSYENNAGNHDRALQLADEARAAIATFDDRETMTVLCTMSIAEAVLGHLDEARADAEQAFRIAQRLANQSVLANANHALLWALQREDPEGALAAFDRFLDVQRAIGVHAGSRSGAAAIAASIRSRLGDDAGALELLHDALVVSRDDGTLPMTAAVLASAVRPLRHTGRNDAAAVMIGAMDHGAVANVASFPGQKEGNARALTRIRDTLGDEKTDQLLQQGVTLNRDQLYEYALTALNEPKPHTP